MPHSSGGGSHGGGSHSGGGSSRSGGGGSSQSSHRSSYFRGAYHYVYYRNGKANHFYNQQPITEENIASRKRTYRGLIIGLSIFYAFFIFGMLGEYIKIPKVPNVNYNDKDVAVTDTADIFSESEEAELLETLKEFQDKSNVTPCILTIENSEWKTHYTSLENYAYEAYIDNYSDEMHWLIVYSTDHNKSWEDWNFEGMQGDDTDPILTVGNTDKFNQTLHKYLLNDRISKFDAFNDSFKELNESIFKVSVDVGGLIIAAIGTLTHAVLFFGMLYLTMGRYIKIDSKAIMLPEGEKKYLEDTCEYCGGLFIHGIHISCPHCGGALPPANGPIFVSDDIKNAK